MYNRQLPGKERIRKEVEQQGILGRPARLHQRAVDLQQPLGSGFPAPGRRSGRAALGQGVASSIGTEQVGQGIDKGSLIAGGNEHGGVSGDLGQAAGVGTEHRGAAGQGFEHGQTKAFVVAGEGEQIGQVVKRRQVLIRYIAQEVDEVGRTRAFDLGQDVLIKPAFGAGDNQVMGQAGAAVDVVMTPSACEFVAPLTFRGITQRDAVVDMFQAAEEHIEIARRADAVVIAPATATTIARLAHGLAEDMVSLTVLATQAPVLVCPAMDSQMYENAATQANLETLRARGVTIVGPEMGRLASGHRGPGRLADPQAILGAVRVVLGRGGDLAGRKVVVTAGGTREPIDPVRYVGNYSSGKMGYALAEAARDRGAEVVLVSALTDLPAPYGVRRIPVRRAVEMRDAVVAECRDAQVLVMAAAVADYAPTSEAEQKLKRRSETLSVELTRTPDILAEAGDGFVKVGFAAESQDLVANARQKLEAKGLDLIVANDITDAQSGFGADTNRVVILDRAGGEERLPVMPKYEVAQRVFDRVVDLLDKGAK